MCINLANKRTLNTAPPSRQITRLPRLQRMLVLYCIVIQFSTVYYISLASSIHITNHVMHVLDSENTPSQGGNYPVDIECYAPSGEDRDLCHQRLTEESLRLFQIADGGLNILSASRENGNVRTLDL